jgi:hypothetical protein
MDYKYDFFLSYSRKNPVGAWVRNHFHPELSQWVDSFAVQPARVFIDRDIEEGEHWPERLEQALRHSKYLVAIWSPQYFSSRWCMAEWQSMRSREARLGLATPQAPRGLIYPVVFSDGKSFPAPAQAVQRQDLSTLNYPNPEFKQTTRYLEFVDRMKSICESLATWIDERPAPAFDPNWPVVRPIALGPPDPALPRIE